MINNELLRLMRCFPNSFVNQFSEIIIHRTVNVYFKVNVQKEIELKYKVLEWLSRDACKTEPFKNNTKNIEFKNFILRGINDYLDTDFSTEDMRAIYEKLGNNVNRLLTEKFVRSGYDLKILINEEDKNGK